MLEDCSLSATLATLLTKLLASHVLEGFSWLEAVGCMDWFWRTVSFTFLLATNGSNLYLLPEFQWQASTDQGDRITMTITALEPNFYCPEPRRLKPKGDTSRIGIPLIKRERQDFDQSSLYSNSILQTLHCDMLQNCITAFRLGSTLPHFLKRSVQIFSTHYN